MTDTFRLVVNIPAVAALSWLFAGWVFPPVISFIKRKPLPHRSHVKPFECPFCLAFWFGLVIFTYHHGFIGVAYAALTARIAAWMD